MGNLLQVLPKLKRTSGGKEGAGILGVHLEGPFISPEKKGAHPLQHIQKVEVGNNMTTLFMGDYMRVME